MLRKVFSPSRVRAIRFTFLLGLLMVSYQNCSSGVSFEAGAALNQSSSPNSPLETEPTDNGGGSTLPDPDVSTPVVTPVVTPGVTPEMPPDGSIPGGGTMPTDPNSPDVMPTPIPGDGLACASPRVPIGQTCVCPAGSNDVGNSCLTCKAGEKFNSMTLKCEMQTVSCPAGQTYDGHDCVAISPSCDSYVEITSSKFAIPPRNMNAAGKGKICYYVKLVSKVAKANSSTFKERRTDIVSRLHGGSGNAPPHVMASKEISFVLQGDREVVLAGDSHGGDDIYVDNYFLVEVMFSGLKKPNLWASGTKDARPLDAKNVEMPIQVNGQDVTDWHAFGDGGTSRFNPINMYGQLAKDKEISFKGSALDCGSVGESSDVYLLFR